MADAVGGRVGSVAGEMRMAVAAVTGFAAGVGRCMPAATGVGFAAAGAVLRVLAVVHQSGVGCTTVAGRRAVAVVAGVGVDG